MTKEFAKNFYNSTTWRKCRNAYFNSKFGICELCGKPGEEVHHKKFLTAENINDADVTLNWDNLQLLCRSCHNAIHEKSYEMYRAKHRPDKGINNGLCFDEEGNIVENKNVFVVWGSPASGKTKYVKEHKGKYDLIVDLDLIIRAIGMMESNEVTGDYLPFALDVRNLLYDLIEERKYYFEKAWIIATLPKKKERTELKERLKAELIHIDTDMETCLMYAKYDDNRKNKQLQYEIIKKYFNKLEL